jgi:uncharacterized membrane protein YebE (DUF533 family)
MLGGARPGDLGPAWRPTERRFLQTLAERTGLDAEIVGEIHDQLEQERPA